MWKECYRVLQPGCRLCVNIGDQFARSVYYGRYKVIPIRTEIIKFCETVGFDYMGAIIWQKVTTTNTTGGATIMGSYPNPRNGILKLDYEFILLFKKQGKSPKPDPEMKAQSAMTKDEWNSYFSGHWNFGGVRQDGHIAMFPEELPARLIKMFAFVGDTVLDPFLGSGTTVLAAKNLSRNSIGYEINQGYLPKIKEKLEVDQSPEQFEFLEDQLKLSPEEEIATLPYIFEDPLKLDKKINPKKKQYGSRISNAEKAEREEYFSVKKVIGPNAVELNDGRMIKLLGIKAKQGLELQAIDFLSKKTKSSKVYLRFDDSTKANGTCYLYLKNRTFLNAHLIKKGLAEVDSASDYKYKKKFLNLQPD